MSQQVRVEQDLVFAGRAGYTPNVKGIIMPEMVILDDHFLFDNDTFDWTEDTEGATMAGDAALIGGAETILTDASGAGMGEIYRLAVWSASKNCGMEARIKVSAATTVCINVGFVDAGNSTDNEVAGMMDGSVGMTAPTVTADYALFVYDTNDVDVYYCTSSEDGTEITTPIAAIGSIVASTSYARLRVQTDTDGNVTFYYNDTAVGYLPDAIAAGAANLLTPYVACMERTSSARTLTIDRITTWQDA